MIIQTKSQKIWIDNEGILNFEELAGREVHTLEDARENITAAQELRRKRKMLVLIDIRHVKKITIEARRYYASTDVAGLNLATAFYVDSLISEVIANFFLGINRLGKYPLKCFYNKEAAKAWLRSQQQDG